MTKKKIVIVYATAGIGHKKASIAVKKALDEMAPEGIDVSIIDALDYTNDFFKWSYLQAYLLMVNKLPLFWGMSYYLTDNFYFNMLIARMRRFNNWLSSGKLANYLFDTKPDVVISTHFFASEVIADLKKNSGLKSRLITVVTDYRLHSWWVAEPTDTYVVAGEDARNDLIRWKVEPSRIKVLGIPIEPIFSKPLNKDDILRKTGLRSGIFTILVIGGGFGVGPIEEIVKVIAAIRHPLQVIAICGHNEELVRRLEELKKQMTADIKVLGFVDNVYEYMEVSDVLISKSGGITVSESLAKEIPLIIISPIMGQETRNADFLMKHGAALKLARVSDLKDSLEYLCAHPDKIKEMKKSIETIKKPMACYDVAKLAIDMV